MLCATSFLGGCQFLAVGAVGGAVLHGAPFLDPHETFINSHNAQIGQRGDRYWRNREPESESLTLANGNTEHKYRLGKCVFFREFDFKTGRLVGWRIEGDEQFCWIVP